jgi:hypothetical protein
MDASNPQLIAAVNDIADEANRFLRAIVVARGVQKLLAILDNDARPAERNRRENASALREMAALGDSRDAAMKVARRRSDDPHRQQILAQRFREARRRQKETRGMRLG